MFVLLSTAPAHSELYPLSLHDALPISTSAAGRPCPRSSPTRRSSDRSTPGSATRSRCSRPRSATTGSSTWARSEEHTSELQSPCNLVCRLLLEKKNKNRTYTDYRGYH